MSSNTVTALMATAAESKHNMLCSVHFWGCIGNPSETRRELWGGYLKSMEFDVPASETRRKPIGNFLKIFSVGNPSETRRELWGGYLKSMEFDVPDVPASETRRKLIGSFSVYIIAIWLSLETSLLVGTMSSDQAGKPNWLTLVSSTHSTHMLSITFCCCTLGGYGYIFYTDECESQVRLVLEIPWCNAG